MGDHRADIKIEMHMHGKTYKQGWWINWWPDDDGVDTRIKDWFAACWEDARQRYEDAVYESESAAREQAQEAQDRAEYTRLKAKFSSPAPVRRPEEGAD